MPGGNNKTLVKIKTGSISTLANPQSNIVNDVGTIYFATETAVLDGDTKAYGQIVYDSPSDGRIVMSQQGEYSDLVSVKKDDDNEIFLGGIFGGSYLVNGSAKSAKTRNIITGTEQSYPIYTELISFKNGTIFAENGLEVGSATIPSTPHGNVAYVSNLLSVNDSRTKIGNDTLTINYPESTNGSLISTVATSITDNTDTSSVSTGALVVTGGVGIGGGLSVNNTISITENTKAIEFRPNNSAKHTFISYQTAGDEALVIKKKTASTSILFTNEEDPDDIASNR